MGEDTPYGSGKFVGIGQATYVGDTRFSGAVAPVAPVESRPSEIMVAVQRMQDLALNAEAMLAFVKEKIEPLNPHREYAALAHEVKPMQNSHVGGSAIVMTLHESADRIESVMAILRTTLNDSDL